MTSQSSVPPAAAPPNPASAKTLTTASDARDLLHSAWERHDIYSRNAGNAQRRFFFMRRTLSFLSVAVVFLAVLQPLLENRFQPISLPRIGGGTYPLTLLDSVNFLLILFPIAITGLLAFAVKFDRGHNWVLLRGNAEALKMEIFYYRTQVGDYKTNRNAVLAKKFKLYSERVKGSPVHQAALSPFEEQGETRRRLGLLVWLVTSLIDGVHWLGNVIWQFLFGIKEEFLTPRLDQNEQAEKYDDLTPSTYLRYRLEDQFNWYRRKAKDLDRQFQVLQASVFIFGGLGTLLAAIQLQNWVAVTTVLTGSIANYMEYRRVEASLVGYNQAADALYDVRAWWQSLSRVEQQKSENFELLVKSTEETIRSEHISWLQDMQDKLSQLYGSTEEDNSKTPLTEGKSDPKSASGSPDEIPAFTVAPAPTATTETDGSGTSPNEPLPDS